MCVPCSPVHVHSFLYTLDAHILFEAVRLGHLPMIRRRLTGEERSQLRSGEVFVWEEAVHKGGLERWTDGRKWYFPPSYPYRWRLSILMSESGPPPACANPFSSTRKSVLAIPVTKGELIFLLFECSLKLSCFALAQSQQRGLWFPAAPT